MGLDMYLDRWTLHGATLEEARAAENYLDWRNHVENFTPKNDRTKPYTFNEWCNMEENEVDMMVVDILRPEYQMRYASWDVKHEYGWKRMSESVGYWRKANQIHKWFVEHVQDGEDDCGEYAVSRFKLEQLKATCEELLSRVVLAPGKVKNGERRIDGKWVPIYEDGVVVSNPEVCAELLPAADGFFFGSTEYDHYYIKDINATVAILDKVLKTTNFDTQTITYHSSW